MDNLIDQTVAALGWFAPSDVLAIVQGQLREISMSNHGGLLTLGFVGTVWSASSVISTLNRA